jgi:hypothetical protein
MATGSSLALRAHCKVGCVAAWLRLPLGDFFRSQTDSLTPNSRPRRNAFLLSSHFPFLLLPRLIRIGPERDW